MRIAFSSLAPHIQHLIAEKLTLNEAPAFEMSSKLSREVAQRVKTPFAPLSVIYASFIYTHKEFCVTFGLHNFIILKDFPQLRFAANRVEILYDLDDVLCGMLLDYLKRSGTTFSELKMVDFALTSPSSFGELLQIADVRTLDVLDEILPEYMRMLPERFYDKINVKSQIEDDDLFRINGSHIRIECCQITDSALNCLLNEWFEKKRKIDYLHLKTMKGLVKDEVLDGIVFSSTDDERLLKLDNGIETLYIFLEKLGTFEAALDASKITFAVYVLNRRISGFPV